MPGALTARSEKMGLCYFETCHHFASGYAVCGRSPYQVYGIHQIGTTTKSSHQQASSVQTSRDCPNGGFAFLARPPGGPSPELSLVHFRRDADLQTLPKLPKLGRSGNSALDSMGSKGSTGAHGKSWRDRGEEVHHSRLWRLLMCPRRRNPQTSEGL